MMRYLEAKRLRRGKKRPTAWIIIPTDSIGYVRLVRIGVE